MEDQLHRRLSIDDCRQDLPASNLLSFKVLTLLALQEHCVYTGQIGTIFKNNVLGVVFLYNNATNLFCSILGRQLREKSQPLPLSKLMGIK